MAKPKNTFLEELMKSMPQPAQPQIDPNTITFPTLGQQGQAGAAEFNATALGPATFPTLQAQGQEGAAEFNATAPAIQPPQIPAELPTSGGSISFDSGPRIGQTFIGGSLTPATAGQISQFEEGADIARQGFEERIAATNPQIAQASVSAANEARGRPINVSTSEVQVAQQQAEDRDLNSAADLAAREFAGTLSVGGGSISDRQEKIAEFRDNFMQENALEAGLTAFQQGSLDRSDRAFRASQSAAARKASVQQAGTKFGQDLATRKQEFTESEAAADRAAGPAKSATDRNIERLMEANPNLSFSEAVNIEQNVVTKTVNPLTGATETTNIASGESTPVKSTEPLPDASLDLTPPESGASLFERGQKFTGAIEAGKRGAQRVTGQLGFDVASEESIQTKKELDAFQGSLSRAFQEGDRFSSSQDKILREELDATLGAMKDPKTFASNMRSLDKVLRERHADLIANHSDTTLDSDFRADSASKARVIEQALNKMGVTQEETQPESSSALPEGINKAVTQDIWDAMTPEEQSVFK